MIKIPVYQPSITEIEKRHVMDCLDSSWISSKGKYIELFENEFAQKIGANYATTVSNGTVALHLALVALGIGPGDEVIVPTLTYIASVNAIMYTGATPIFVDSDLDTWQMDPIDVQKKISRNTRAIMVVHLYGHAVNMEKIGEIAKENDLFVIEDCAESIGSLFNNRHVGTFGDISTFSFFGNKTITTGEGGMVVCANKSLHDKVTHLKGQGLAKHRQYWHDVIGYNYRMTNICAAIGFAQMQRWDSIIKDKRVIAEKYKSLLSDLPFALHAEASDVYHSYWMCSVLCDKDLDRDNLMKHLYAKGIETRPLFYPIHTMPMYSKKYEVHPNAENLSYRGINLPSWPGLSDDMLVYIVESMKSCI